MNVEQAKEVLKQNGYFVNNLWHVDDVKLRHKCNDDEVAQIKKCKHIFTANQLNIWFQSNVKCPTCRYDIRNYNDEEEETNLNNQTNQTNNIEQNNLNNNNQLHIYDISNNEVNFETFVNFFDTL